MSVHLRVEIPETDRRRTFTVKRVAIVLAFLTLFIAVMTQCRFFLSENETQGRYVWARGAEGQETWYLLEHGVFYQLCEDLSHGRCVGNGRWMLRKNDLGTQVVLTQVTVFAGSQGPARNYRAWNGAIGSVNSIFGAVKIHLRGADSAEFLKKNIPSPLMEKELLEVRRMFDEGVKEQARPEFSFQK